jgi:D-beta-D-heptose 7-phosphate kinase/D-beta-D-heptose 1-phosphate adenosyltransferase
MPLARARAEEVLRAFRGRRIAVVGDLMLDHFVWGSVSRISPEAPVPVVRVTRESFHLGGAGNVVSNLAALGAAPAPAGVVGRDEAGRRLVEALAAAGAPLAGIVESGRRATTKKTRVIAHAQQVVRFDREEDEPLAGPDAAALQDAARAALEGASALIVSDYEKGTVTAALLEVILEEARRRSVPAVVDPKPANYAAYRPVTAITPNVGEASQISGVRIRDDADAERAAAGILAQLGCGAVLLTRGEKGMLLAEKGSAPARIPAAAREVYDVTGAGDTVVAAFTLAVAAGASFREAAELANAAAGVVVGKVGTATAAPEEVIRCL